MRKTVPEEVIAAYQKMLEYFSASFCKKLKLDQDIPSLLSMHFSDFELELTLPDLRGNTIEKTLNELDCTTPENLLYDDLIPLGIRFSVQDATVTLRDFSIPIFSISGQGSPSWKISGLVIIADPRPRSESLKTIYLPLNIKNAELTVVKNVNPVKIYCETQTTFTSSKPVKFCFGAAYEPSLADVIAVIDSFTKPNVDKSPPIGWWDKLRVMFHGSNVIKLVDSTELRILIDGSFSPYCDRLKTYGTLGIEFALRENVELEIGGKGDLNQNTIKCGNLRLILPDQKTEHELSILDFSGDVSILLLLDFVTKDIKTGIISRPWKKHHELVMRTPENCPIDQRSVL
jgi:hypothetical protein